MSMLGDKGAVYEGIMMGPLGEVPFDPDVIVLYVSPARALRLIIGFAFKEGRAVESTMTGQASLCSAVALAVDKGKVTVDIPCIGDRTYGLVQEHELLVAFPAAMLPDLIEGLLETEGVASYPYSPFLRWSTLFPPTFEPRPNELE
jgi:uncharacterized protein (DUF169 family)